MAKEKKITIKYYLNKNQPSSHNAMFYPLFMQITFNRKVYNFSQLILPGEQVFWKEEDLEKFENGNFSGGHRGVALELKEREKIIEDIVRYEYRLLQEDYSLKGFNDRYHWYLTPLSSVFENSLLDLFQFQAHHEKGITLSERLSVGKLVKYLIDTDNSKVDDIYLVALEAYTGLLLQGILLVSPDDSVFGAYNSIYHWIIKDGKKRFGKIIRMLEDPLSKEAKNNLEHYRELEKELTHLPARPDVYLINNFMPSSKKLSSYIKLIDIQLNRFIAAKKG